MSRPAKVLIVGKANHLGWFEHTVNGFRQASCETALFAINHLTAFDKFIFKVKQKINTELASDHLASLFDKKIKTFQPDTIVFVSAFFIPLKLYEIAKSNRIPIAAWAGDKFGPEAGVYRPFIDKFYASDTALVSLAETMGFSQSELLQFGYDKKLHYNRKLPRSNHFNFVGSYTYERDITFAKLTDYPLMIKGYGWNNLSTISPHWIIENTTVTPEQLSLLYNTTTATLNVAQLNNIINMVNMRTFEAIACGSCMISDNIADIPLCFEPHKEILVYNSHDELIELCERIIKEPEFATRIAAAGEKRVQQSPYGYDDKARKILTDLSIHP